MSVVHDQGGINQRVSERPSLDLGRLRDVKKRDLVYRFLAGAGASLLAGVVTLVFGAHVGGLFLAFPAILAASLTLIEEQEDGHEAREDARGAVVGGAALAVFAVIAALTIGHTDGAIALTSATIAWFVAAGLAYLIIWFK